MYLRVGTRPPQEAGIATNTLTIDSVGAVLPHHSAECLRRGSGRASSPRRARSVSATGSGSSAAAACGDAVAVITAVAAAIVSAFAIVVVAASTAAAVTACIIMQQRPHLVRRLPPVRLLHGRL